MAHYAPGLNRGRCCLKYLWYVSLLTDDHHLVSSAALCIVKGGVGSRYEFVEVANGTFWISGPRGRSADTDGHDPLGGIVFMRYAQVLNEPAHPFSDVSRTVAIGLRQE
jgi:hypothetical protein